MGGYNLASIFLVGMLVGMAVCILVQLLASICAVKHWYHS